MRVWKPVSGILCMVFFFGLCACGASKVVDDITDQTANVVQSQNKNVLGVKGGTRSDYPAITYEKAFEEFFSSPTWKYFKGTQEGPDEDGDGKPDYTRDNIDVVEFTGYCTYQNVDVKALIQFELDNSAGTFDAVYLSFNDVPQSSLMLTGLLNKVFESYSEKHGIQQVTSEGQQEQQIVLEAGAGSSAASSAPQTQNISVDQLCSGRWCGNNTTDREYMINHEFSKDGSCWAYVIDDAFYPEKHVNNVDGRYKIDGNILELYIDSYYGKYIYTKVDQLSAHSRSVFTEWYPNVSGDTYVFYNADDDYFLVQM